MVAWYEIRVPN